MKLAHEKLLDSSPCFWDVGGNVAAAEEHLLRLGASPKAARLAAERRDKLGGFGDKGASLTLAEVVALGSKCYSEFLTNSSESFHKFKAKSMAKQHRKQLTHKAYREAWMEGTPGEAVTSYRFESRSHVVNLVCVQKVGLSPFTDKVYQLDMRNSQLHGH